MAPSRLWGKRGQIDGPAFWEREGAIGRVSARSYLRERGGRFTDPPFESARGRFCALSLLGEERGACAILRSLQPGAGCFAGRRHPVESSATKAREQSKKRETKSKTTKKKERERRDVEGGAIFRGGLQ